MERGLEKKLEKTMDKLLAGKDKYTGMIGKHAFVFGKPSEIECKRKKTFLSSSELSSEAHCDEAETDNKSDKEEMQRVDIYLSQLNEIIHQNELADNKTFFSHCLLDTNTSPRTVATTTVPTFRARLPHAFRSAARVGSETFVKTSAWSIPLGLVRRYPLLLEEGEDNVEEWLSEGVDCGLEESSTNAVRAVRSVVIFVSVYCSLYGNVQGTHELCQELRGKKDV